MPLWDHPTRLSLSLPTTFTTYTEIIYARFPTRLNSLFVEQSRNRIHGAPNALLNKRFMNRANPRAASKTQAAQITRSVPNTLSSGTHLLEAVLVPGIIIARIITGKVGGMNLEQKETSPSAKGQAGKVRPNSSLFHSVFSSRAQGHRLTLRTPNSPRTTRVRISCTASAAAIFNPSA